MAGRTSRLTTNPTVRTSKRRIPEGTPCGYCFDEWAKVWDHLQPYSKHGLTIPENLYPSCARCNGLLSNLSFPTIQEKREYVRTTLIERGDWNPIMEGAAFMPDVQSTVSEDAEDSDILQPGLQETGLVAGSEKHLHLSDLSNPVRKTKAATKVLQSEMPVAGLAQPKSRKHALKRRPCRTCRESFIPQYKTQVFCDKLCKSNKGIGHRLEKRVLTLMRDEIELRLKPLFASMFDLERKCGRCRGKRLLRGSTCPTCSGIGVVLTDFGRSVVSLIDRRRNEIRR